MKRIKILEQSNFNEAVNFVKHPAKVALAIVKDNKGKFNMITLEWFMRTSLNPPMFAISIGHSRYSYQCLQDFRYFNLCIPSKEMVEEVKLCGTKSGRDIDKLEVTGLDWLKGRLAQLPVLKDGVANFECEITTQVKSGDHTIFVGEVKHSWLGEK
ncbi:MAG: flavin reductase family protein [Candidatus Cloacimonetes bacterium]|nr:flavin reductase family protein [Candidatus Cloacimonadota bacterium]